jgi:hypothetical protein
LQCKLVTHWSKLAGVPHWWPDHLMAKTKEGVLSCRLGRQLQAQVGTLSLQAEQVVLWEAQSP